MMNHVPGEKEQATASLYVHVLKAVCDDYIAYPWITVELLLAIVSRETWWGWSPGYYPKGKSEGTGDGRHGKGYFQIDDRSHAEWIRKDLWGDVEQSAIYAIENVLVPNYFYLKARFQDLPKDDIVRGAIAGYNCGAGNVRRSLNAGGMPFVDSRTAGRDYSEDVLELKEWWATWLRNREPKTKEGN
jgi:hypothetical protein